MANNLFMSLGELQCELTKRNYIIDVEYIQSMMHITAKYKSISLFLLFLMISVIAGFLLKILALNLNIVIFVSILWILAWAFLRACKVTEMLCIKDVYKCMRLNTAHELFKLYYKYSDMSETERDNVFENDIAPYVGLQRIKDSSNTSNDK